MSGPGATSLPGAFSSFSTINGLKSSIYVNTSFARRLSYFVSLSFTAVKKSVSLVPFANSVFSIFISSVCQLIVLHLLHVCIVVQYETAV